ncbi:hypothetical protein D9M68_781650 [compost metagenome]
MVTSNDTRTILDLDDTICRKANQLCALTGHLSGDAGPCFRALPEHMRSAYLGLIHELSAEIVDTLDEIGKLRLKARDLGHPG